MKRYDHDDPGPGPIAEEIQEQNPETQTNVTTIGSESPPVVDSPTEGNPVMPPNGAGSTNASDAAPDEQPGATTSASTAAAADVSANDSSTSEQATPTPSPTPTSPSSPQEHGSANMPPHQSDADTSSAAGSVGPAASTSSSATMAGQTGHSGTGPRPPMGDPDVNAIFSALGQLIGEVREAARRDTRLAASVIEFGRSIEALGHGGLAQAGYNPGATGGWAVQPGVAGHPMTHQPQGHAGEAAGGYGTPASPESQRAASAARMDQPAPPQVRGPRVIAFEPEGTATGQVERAPLRLGGMSFEVPVRDSQDEVDRLRGGSDFGGEFTGGSGGLSGRPGGVEFGAGVADSGLATSDESEDADSAPDLALIRDRARLKAECYLWSVERRRLMEEEEVEFDEEIKPRDEELLARVKELPGCYAWTLDPYANLPYEDEPIEIMAYVFQNLALMTEVMEEVLDYQAHDREEFVKRAYMLLAETQSAVRRALRDAGERRTDQDQDDTFRWLRIRTKRDQVYVSRFMTLQDPADPSIWDDTRERIYELRDEVRTQHETRRLRHNLIGKIKYIIKRMPDFAEDELDQQWQTLADTIDKLVTEGGVRPSDRELRGQLR
ncbi:MAG: hypothetical protein ACOC0P_04665, partial [Planctomycetota bacterium]